MPSKGKRRRSGLLSFITLSLNKCYIVFLVFMTCYDGLSCWFSAMLCYIVFCVQVRVIIIESIYSIVASRPRVSPFTDIANSFPSSRHIEIAAGLRIYGPFLRSDWRLTPLSLDWWWMLPVFCCPHNYAPTGEVGILEFTVALYPNEHRESILERSISSESSSALMTSLNELLLFFTFLYLPVEPNYLS